MTPNCPKGLDRNVYPEPGIRDFLDAYTPHALKSEDDPEKFAEDWGNQDLLLDNLRKDCTKGSLRD